MRCSLRLIGAALAVLLASCATRPPALDLDGWQAPLGRQHPLTGRIWDAPAATGGDLKSRDSSTALASRVGFSEKYTASFQLEACAG